MKNRTFALVFALIVVLVFALAGCGSTPASQPADSSGSTDVSTFKTLGDILAVTAIDQYSYNEEKYAGVFQIGETYYRVLAESSQEIWDGLNAIDFFDEDRDEKTAELLGPLEIEKIDDLTAAMPSQDELAGYAGKTGQDLIDEGFETNGWSFYDEDPLYFMVCGDYEYDVTMNGPVDIDPNEEVDGEGMLPELTVKSMVITGISGHATDF